MRVDPHHETWEPPRELQRSLPRQVSLTQMGVTYVILGVSFLLAALGVGWVIGIQGNAWRRVEQQGETTDATVTRLWIGGGKSHERMVSYRFTAGSTEIVGRSSLGAKAWGALHQGGLLSIRYVPLAPNLNHPPEGAPAPAPAWLVFGIVLWPAAVFWAILYRHRQLLSLGAAARAIVTEVSHDNFGRGGRGRKFRVRCTFTPAGREATTATFNRRTAPAVGTALCILYDPEKPRRNAVYPLELVKVRGE